MFGKTAIVAVCEQEDGRKICCMRENVYLAVFLEKNAVFSREKSAAMQCENDSLAIFFSKKCCFFFERKKVLLCVCENVSLAVFHLHLFQCVPLLIPLCLNLN